MLTPVLLILVGFALLTKSADFLVSGASSLARALRISDLVIGLTIVAIGTSAPEMVVSFLSAAKGNSGIAVGNVIGSNIANLCLVLGCAGVMAPLTISQGTKWADLSELLFCLGTAVLLCGVLILGNREFLVSRVEGLLLLAGMLIYAVWMLIAAKTSRRGKQKETETRERPIALSIGLAVAGLVGLVLGGNLIVDNALQIATHFGASQELTGITIVALGTSLPELATSIVSIVKGNVALAVGNVLGSNIINTCLVLGGAAAINPIAMGRPLLVDALTILAVTAILVGYVFTGKKRKLDRWEALFFLGIYVAYMVHVFWQG